MTLPKLQTNNLSFEQHVKIHRKMGVTNCGDVNYEGTCCCTSGKNRGEIVSDARKNEGVTKSVNEEKETKRS